MNNSRKAHKAYQIWNYYFYRKKNYAKALVNYVRSIKPRSRFLLDEQVLYLIWECYWFLESYEESLAYANKSLEISSGHSDAWYLKWSVLIKMWREAEWNKIINEWNELDERTKNKELDLDAFYNKK